MYSDNIAQDLCLSFNSSFIHQLILLPIISQLVLLLIDLYVLGLLLGVCLHVLPLLSIHPLIFLLLNFCPLILLINIVRLTLLLFVCQKFSLAEFSSSSLSSSSLLSLVSLAWSRASFLT